MVVNRDGRGAIRGCRTITTELIRIDSYYTARGKQWTKYEGTHRRGRGTTVDRCCFDAAIEEISCIGLRQEGGIETRCKGYATRGNDNLV